MRLLPGYIVINIDPVLLHLGPLSLRWYGLMYAVGLFVALRVVTPSAYRLGLSRDDIYRLFWGVTIAGLIGGRLYYVVQSGLGAYLRHPWRIFAFWEGGMAFYGAIFLGVPVLAWLCRGRVHALAVLDIVALFAPLAQAFGRIGNIINGDIVGYPSTLPWATAYANPGAFARPLCADSAHCTAFQPAAAYELLFSLGLFAVLWILRQRHWPQGLHFVLYLALYSAGQLVLFAWRDNSYVLGPLKQAQATAIVVLIALVPVALIVARHPWSARRATGAPLHVAEGA